MRIDEDTLIEGHSKRFLQDTQNYLFIMLERRKYRQTDDGIEYVRVDDPLSFPITNLDLSPYFLIKEHAKGPYELVGVIMHDGSANGGHYTAYTKLGNQWYYCNDAKVKKISSKEMQEISERGTGVNKTVVPTTFVYELSSARPTHKG